VTTGHVPCREEGARALYRGFLPKALRLGLGQTIGLLAFRRLLRLSGADYNT
jgi:solute carrier family 25 (mitochondrial 2-oxodicarboxylate transporter), member 21